MKERKNYLKFHLYIIVNNFHLSRANCGADDSRTWFHYKRTTFRQEIFYVFIVQYFNDRNACFLFFYSYKLIWINFLRTVECINFVIVSYRGCCCLYSQFFLLFSNSTSVFRTNTCYFSWLRFIHTQLHDQFTFQFASLNGLCLLCKLSSVLLWLLLTPNNRKNVLNNTSK